MRTNEKVVFICECELYLSIDLCEYIRECCVYLFVGAVSQHRFM